MRKLEKFIAVLFVVVVFFGLAGMFLVVFGKKMDEKVLFVSSAFKSALKKTFSNSSKVEQREYVERLEEVWKDSLSDREMLRKILSSPEKRKLAEKILVSAFSQRKIPLFEKEDSLSLFRSLESVVMQDIFRHRRGEAINCVLRDRRLLTAIKEELAVQAAIESGIKKCPEIVADYGRMVYDSCSKKGIDPDLGIAIIAIESQGYHKAKSPKGAIGLWQVMPASARQLRAERGKGFPSDRAKAQTLLSIPEISTSLGTDHFRRSLNRFQDPVKALIAYEAGDAGVPRQIRRYGRPEKVPYYRKVYGVYAYLKEQKRENVPSAMSEAPDVALAY